MSELHSFYIGKDVGLDVLNSGLLNYATVTMEVWNFVFQRGQKNWYILTTVLIKEFLFVTKVTIIHQKI